MGRDSLTAEQSRARLANIRNWEVETLAPYYHTTPEGLRALIRKAREDFVFCDVLQTWVPKTGMVAHRKVLDIVKDWNAKAIKTDRPKKMYLSGPMRGKDLDNWPAFDAAAKILRDRGIIVISPADMERALGRSPGCLDGASREEIVATVDRDMQAVRSLNPEYGDAVVVLPGWQKSVGARAEVAYAMFLNIPILRLSQDNFEQPRLISVNWDQAYPPPAEPYTIGGR